MTSFASKMCPILSKGNAVLDQPKVVAALGSTPRAAELDVLPCAGPSCMWFVPIADEHGRVTDGGCAPALLPAAAAQIRDAVGGIQAMFNNTKGS